jgi:ribokinase
VSRVVSVGSVIIDMSLQVAAMPEPGGDVLASAPVLAAGGGFNLMNAAARQGASVAYAGGYGTGPRGRLVRQALRQAGITALRGPSRGADTGLCLTFVDAQAERTFVTVPGAEATRTPRQLGALALQPGDVVAMSGYDLAYPGAAPALAGWVSGLPAGVPVLLDPGPLVASIPAAIWEKAARRADVLTVNEREARLLAGGPDVPGPDVSDPGTPAGDPAARHEQIRRRHRLRAGALLVVRRGAGGCTFSGGQDHAPVTPVPAMKVTAADTTGAGDTHTGVFLAGWVAGLGVPDALRRASIAAAISVTRPGPASAPSPAEIDQAISWLGGPAGDAGTWPGLG